MKLGIDFLTGLLCKIWDRLTISIPLLWKGIFKKVFVVSSFFVMFAVWCRPSLKLARSFIISGICFGILCSKSRSFASSMRMPSFLCNKLKTNVLSSCTNPGLLQLLTKFLSLCSRSVRVVLCFLVRFCARFLNFLGFFIKKWPHYDIFCALFWDIA